MQPGHEQRQRGQRPAGCRWRAAVLARRRQTAATATWIACAMIAAAVCRRQQEKPQADAQDQPGRPPLPPAGRTGRAAAVRQSLGHRRARRSAVKASASASLTRCGTTCSPRPGISATAAPIRRKTSANAQTIALRPGPDSCGQLGQQIVHAGTCPSRAGRASSPDLLIGQHRHAAAPWPAPPCAGTAAARPR